MWLVRHRTTRTATQTPYDLFTTASLPPIHFYRLQGGCKCDKSITRALGRKQQSNKEQWICTGGSFQCFQNLVWFFLPHHAFLFFCSEYKYDKDDWVLSLPQTQFYPFSLVTGQLSFLLRQVCLTSRCFCHTSATQALMTALGLASVLTGRHICLENAF